MKNLFNKKYYINTYGCQMNVHESEKIAGILESKGYTYAETQENADIIVLNTCCIRETAETRVFGNLGIIKNLKERKPELIVCICGCMPQKEDTAQKLKEKYKYIDIILGTHNIHKLGEHIDELTKTKRIFEIFSDKAEIVENTPVYRTSGINAWVNIMYGCNNFCSYCIVPYVRGREKSRRSEQIIADIKKLVQIGYKEITLLGQNVNSYGNDFVDGHKNFASLLKDISNIDGKFRLRFMTSHPKDLSLEVVETIAESDKIARFIHLPLQAGSDRILAAMNRKYTSVDYLNTIDMIRRHIPDVGLSSDCMVGFPSETEEDFLDTLRVIETVKFNNLYSFIYSRRSGTVADKMENQVDIAVKKDRIKRLIKKQFEVGKSLSKNCVGKTFEILVESHVEQRAFGKSSCGKAVEFRHENNIVGEFVDVKVAANKNNKLFGEVENDD